MPFALATGMGSTFDCADHSNRVCFLLRSIISFPVMDVSIAVVIMSLKTPLIFTDDRGFLRKNPCKSVAENLELTRMLFGPSLHNDFLIGIELYRVAALPVQIAEEAALPSAE